MLKTGTLFYSGSSSPEQAVDLYPCPGTRRGTVAFIHGGAWISDDKDQYEHLAKFFLSHGYGFANINYRLSRADNSVRHPAHVEDCQRAIELVQRHNAEPLFLMGHSAGAFLCAQVASRVPSIAAIIGLSGIYDLPKLAQRFPTYPDWFLNTAFGSNQGQWQAASPRSLSYPNPVRWLLIHSPEDELVDTKQSQDFADRLRQLSHQVEIFTEVHEKHHEIMMTLGSSSNPATGRILAFLGTALTNVFT